MIFYISTIDFNLFQTLSLDFKFAADNIKLDLFVQPVHLISHLPRGLCSATVTFFVPC